MRNAEKQNGSADQTNAGQRRAASGCRKRATF